jgi:ATP phosphoribosyltransferase
MLTVALPKGALLKDSIRLFQAAGLDFSAFLDSSNRQLQIQDPTGRAQALLVRTHDVPVYVEYGQAQLGVAGYDVLKEKQPKVAHLRNLGFGFCRMSVAVPDASPFDALDIPVEIIPLYGSVELGPITGMSEAIVDLVSTGRTLKENGLMELEVLYESTARLIAHPLSYRLNTHGLQNWVEKIQPAIGV